MNINMTVRAYINVVQEWDDSFEAKDQPMTYWFPIGQIEAQRQQQNIRWETYLIL